MRIEITIEGSEPIIHRLTKEKTLVGSGTDCDIQVAAEGVSRKHLLIIAKDDEFFVVDQGSTNGSFVDESRLVPGQRTEFNSFFPIKLGHAVTVALLADEEGAPKFELSKAITETTEPVAKKAEPKVAVAAKKSTGTEPIQLMPKSKATKSGAATPRDKKAPTLVETKSQEDQDRMRNTKIIAFVVLIGGLAYYYFQKEAPPEVATETPTDAKVATVQMKVSELKLSDSFPSNIQNIQNYIGLPKCNADETEKAICEGLLLPNERIPTTGMRRENDVIQFFLPALSAVQARKSRDEAFRTRFEKVTTEIDFIDFFLGRIEPERWKTYTSGARWVVVIFITPDNAPEGSVWFAPISTINSTYETPEYVARRETYAAGTVLLNIIGGLFRQGSP